MKLSEEDIKILKLERDLQYYQKLTALSNNTEPYTSRYHNKAMKLLQEQSSLLFKNGNYRKDKKAFISC